MDTLPLGSPERRPRPEVVALANYKAGPGPLAPEVSPKGGPARRLACALAKRLRRGRARADHPASLIHRPWPRDIPCLPQRDQRAARRGFQIAQRRAFRSPSVFDDLPENAFSGKFIKRIMGPRRPKAPRRCCGCAKVMRIQSTKKKLKADLSPVRASG
jgi:hypothetical protein